MVSLEKQSDEKDDSPTEVNRREMYDLAVAKYSEDIIIAMLLESIRENGIKIKNARGKLVTKLSEWVFDEFDAPDTLPFGIANSAHDMAVATEQNLALFLLLYKALTCKGENIIW